VFRNSDGGIHLPFRLADSSPLQMSGLTFPASPFAP
jgi:hypothetical protein